MKVLVIANLNDTVTNSHRNGLNYIILREIEALKSVVQLSFMFCGYFEDDSVRCIKLSDLGCRDYAHSIGIDYRASVKSFYKKLNLADHIYDVDLILCHLDSYSYAKDICILYPSTKIKFIIHNVVEDLRLYSMFAKFLNYLENDHYVVFNSNFTHYRALCYRQYRDLDIDESLRSCIDNCNKFRSLKYLDYVDRPYLNNITKDLDFAMIGRIAPNKRAHALIKYSNHYHVVVQDRPEFIEDSNLEYYRLIADSNIRLTTDYNELYRAKFLMCLHPLESFGLTPLIFCNAGYYPIVLHIKNKPNGLVEWMQNLELDFVHGHDLKELIKEAEAKFKQFDPIKQYIRISEFYTLNNFICERLS